MNKIKQNIYKTSQCIKETLKLLWQFKWYIMVYLLFYSSFIAEYLNPPEKDALIWGSDAMEGVWNYVNQEVYIGSMRDTLIILLFFFLIGTSNMRNHPTLAKIIFLSPVLGAVVGLIIEIFQ